MDETKIATLLNVREHNEGEAVELWVNRSGRMVIRAFNECHNNCTDVDLQDLIEWLRHGIIEVEDGGRGITALPTSERDK